MPRLRYFPEMYAGNTFYRRVDNEQELRYELFYCNFNTMQPGEFAGFLITYKDDNKNSSKLPKAVIEWKTYKDKDKEWGIACWPYWYLEQLPEFQNKGYHPLAEIRFCIENKQNPKIINNSDLSIESFEKLNKALK